MVLPPELREGETVLATPRNFYGVIIAITNERICIRPQKGKTVVLPADVANQEIELTEIRKLRRTGFLEYAIEIETKDRLHQLPKFTSIEGDKFIKALVETAGLRKTEWNKEKSRGEKAAKGIIGGTMAVLGGLSAIVSIILAILCFLVGFLLCLTIIGIIPGILLIILGFFFIAGAAGSGMIGKAGSDFGLAKREEWERQ